MQSLEALLFVWHRGYAGPFTNAETQLMARVVVEPTQTQKKAMKNVNTDFRFYSRMEQIS